MSAEWWQCFTFMHTPYTCVCINEMQLYFVFADCVHTGYVVPFSLQNCYSVDAGVWQRC